MVVAGVSGRQEMLAAVLDPAHGMIEFERERGDRRLFRRQPRLRPETAAHVGRDDANVALLEPEHLGQSQPDDVRHLGRGVDDELVQPMVAIGQHRAPLERHRDMPVHAIGPAHHHVGGAGHLVEVALLEYPLDEQVVRPALVHQAGRLGQRGGRVDDCRQHLEIDADRIGEVLRFGAGRRDACGNGVADIADLLRCQRRIARDLEPVHLRHRPHLGEARQVARGEDASLGVGRDGDALDAGMRVRAADKGDVLRVRQPHVGHELSAPVQVARVFLAQQRGADAKPGAGRGMHHALALWCVAPASASSPPASVAAAALMAVTILV